jgi:hypothetical protein
VIIVAARRLRAVGVHQAFLAITIEQVAHGLPGRTVGVTGAIAALFGDGVASWVVGRAISVRETFHAGARVHVAERLGIGAAALGACRSTLALSRVTGLPCGAVRVVTALTAPAAHAGAERTRAVSIFQALHTAELVAARVGALDAVYPASRSARAVLVVAAARNDRERNDHQKTGQDASEVK